MASIIFKLLHVKQRSSGRLALDCLRETGRFMHASGPGVVLLDLERDLRASTLANFALDGIQQRTADPTTAVLRQDCEIVDID